MSYQHRHRYSHLENRVIWWKIKDLKNITCIILENKNNFWRKGKYIVFWLKIVILQRNGFFILLLPARVFLVVQKIDLYFRNSKFFVVGANSWSIYVPNYPTFASLEEKSTKIVNVHKFFVASSIIYWASEWAFLWIWIFQTLILLAVTLIHVLYTF